MKDRSSDPEIERKLDRWAASQTDAGFSPELQRKIQSALKSSLSPVNPIAAQSILVLRFLGVFVVCAAGLIAILGKSGFHLMTTAQIGWITLILAGIAILFA